ncbi:MAG: hypothetical protein EXR76_16995 [Myxococcales bacterium]|nr:hypothetical protein [Myxococcales bacterium]
MHVLDDGCHLTRPVPQDSCETALVGHIGAVRTAVRFERLAWDAALADSVRVGSEIPGVAELRAMPEGVADHRIVYRLLPRGRLRDHRGVRGCFGLASAAPVHGHCVDVTPIDTALAAHTSTLSFHVNPDAFLCEGTAVTDASGAAT